MHFSANRVFYLQIFRFILRSLWGSKVWRTAPLGYYSQILVIFRYILSVMEFKFKEENKDFPDSLGTDAFLVWVLRVFEQYRAQISPLKSTPMKIMFSPCFQVQKACFLKCCDTYDDEKKKSASGLRMSAFILQSFNDSFQKINSDSFGLLHRKAKEPILINCGMKA